MHTKIIDSSTIDTNMSGKAECLRDSGLFLLLFHFLLQLLVFLHILNSLSNAGCNWAITLWNINYDWLFDLASIESFPLWLLKLLNFFLSSLVILHGLFV